MGHARGRRTRRRGRVLNSRPTRLLIALALASTACGSDKTASTASASASAATLGETIPGLELGLWDPAKNAAAWKGAWVVKDRGSYHAWDLHEGSLTWFGKSPFPDASGDTLTLKLALDAPCRATLQRTNADGSVIDEVGMAFTLLEGKLYPSPRGAGFVKGDEAVFCEPGGAVHRRSKTGCRVFERATGATTWTGRTGDCAFVDREGKRCFTLQGKLPSASDCIELVGGALIPNDSPPIEVATFEIAKKTASSLNAAR
ncbi:MAG: hypothetical protein U0271_21350 [Polyangiaceae bacterium]